MARFIVRRLIGVVLLMFIVSAATFAVFFLGPKFVGADVARNFCGRVCNEQSLVDVRAKLGLDEPIYEQYGRYVKGIFVGRTFGSGSTARSCDVPCLGYSFKTDLPVWGQMTDRLPITIS